MNQILIATHTAVHRCTNQTFLPDLFDGVRNATTCVVEVNSFNKLALIVANIVAILLSLAGIIAVGLIITGGFMYIVSNGDSAGIKRAKDTIVNALFGLGIILVAFGAVRFISEQFK